MKTKIQTKLTKSALTLPKGQSSEMPKGLFLSIAFSELVREMTEEAIQVLLDDSYLCYSGGSTLVEAHQYSHEPFRLMMSLS